jgi:hypothetical protein
MLTTPSAEAFNFVSDENNRRAEAVKFINARAQLAKPELAQEAVVGTHHRGISKQLRADLGNVAPAGMLMARKARSPEAVSHTVRNRKAPAANKPNYGMTLEPKH